MSPTAARFVALGGAVLAVGVLLVSRAQSFESPRAQLRAAAAVTGDQPAARVPRGQEFDCGYRPPEFWLEELRAAVRRGEIADPRDRPLPVVAPGAPQSTGVVPDCLMGQHIFRFEDSDELLLNNFSAGALLDLMAQAANAVVAAHGDNFDFVGFWTNFVPHHTIGAAFYHAIENDVNGIGLGLFNNRSAEGIAGENIEGFVMMWNIDNDLWQPGSGPEAAFTRLALGQEFEHRFAMFLPPLPDGRVLQGGQLGCGRTAHWNWKVDGQGSSMEISEWVGVDPAVPVGTFISFNTDTGGVFSYPDLYLMGYVSAAETDVGGSELRYMETSGCSSDYFGTISDFSSADIIASAGPRSPDSSTAQQHFRTAWVMIHLPSAGIPGGMPTQAQLDKVVGILEQHMVDWELGTLGRGTMNNQLFADCNCNGIIDRTDTAWGGSFDINGNGIPDECECLPDVNGDGAVDLPDLIDLLVCFEHPGSPPCDGADINGDATVNVLDLIALLLAFGSSCP